MVAGVKRKVTRKKRLQRQISGTSREARLSESTITPSEKQLNVTTMAIAGALDTSGKGKRLGKTQSTTKLPMMALPTDFIVAVIVTIAVLALLFWILIVLWERRRRTRKWEDYKIYEQERREYKRQMKLRRKRSKKSKKKGEFAKKGGRLHVPTELQRKKRYDTYARKYGREKNKANKASNERNETDKPSKEVNTQGSRDEHRLEKSSHSKEGGSRQSKDNEPKQSPERGMKEHEQENNKREECAEPADVNEIERAIKSGKMSLASYEKAPEKKMKGEMVSMTANGEEEAFGKKEEAPEKKSGDSADKWLHEDYLF